MNIYSWLNEKGYIGPVNESYKDHCVYFYKRIPNTNHQWVIREHKFPIPNGSLYHSFEVEMVFESQDETWANIHFYGVRETELIEKLDSMEKRLYQAVIPMGGNANEYRAKSDEELYNE